MGPEADYIEESNRTVLQGIDGQLWIPIDQRDQGPRPEMMAAEVARSLKSAL